MQKLLLLVMISIALRAGLLQSQPLNWARSAGGTDYDLARAVAIDDSGNRYMVGSFKSSTITFGAWTLSNAHPGRSDLFLVKYDKNGTPRWAMRAGGNSEDEAHSVAVDRSGSCYVAGYFRSDSINFGAGTLKKAGNWDIFIVKVNPEGKTVWANRAGGRSGDITGGVAVDDVGNSYLVGSFSNPVIDFGTGVLTNVGGFDLFIVKYDPAGVPLWARREGGSGGDYASGIAVDETGNIHMVGYFQSPTINFGTGVLTNAGNVDLFLVKYSPRGTALWATGGGGTAGDEARSIAVDRSGNCYLAASFQSPVIDFGTGGVESAGKSDILLTKYGPNGDLLWANVAGGKDFDGASGVAADDSGNVYLTGFFRSSIITFGAGALTNVSEDTADVFIVKFNPSGAVLWQTSMGGKGVDAPSGIAVDRWGKVCVVGSFSSGIFDYGTGTLSDSQAGGSAVFIVDIISFD